MNPKAIILTIALFFVSLGLSAQVKDFSGTVADVNGEPLIGVSVFEKGTTNGVITDLDGNYNISVLPGRVLEFSYVGMETQSVTAAAQTRINIIMKPDSQVLNETVVIGYGTAKRSDLTGSIGSVNSETILKQPALSPIQSAQGKLSGVNIINNDAPGAAPTIVIRGLGTALSGRNPLYIVDGFAVSNISNISSSDILSMDILKDASSSSIYGIRAANGVVIITTKKGQAGKAQISVDAYYGVKNMANKVKMANASQYIEYFNENQASIGATWKLADASKQSNNTDWYDELLQTGTVSNTAVSISGGSDKVDYFVGYDYYTED